MYNIHFPIVTGHKRRANRSERHEHGCEAREHKCSERERLEQKSCRQIAKRKRLLKQKLLEEKVEKLDNYINPYIVSNGDIQGDIHNNLAIHNTLFTNKIMLGGHMLSAINFGQNTEIHWNGDAYQQPSQVLIASLPNMLWPAPQHAMGGYGPPSPTTDEVQTIANSVKLNVEATLGAKYTTYVASEYQRRLVRGYIYLIKVQVDNGAFIIVQIVNPPISVNEPNTLMHASPYYEN